MLIIRYSFLRNKWIRSINRLFAFILIGVLVVPTSFATDIWIKPKEIKFDFESGSSNDAITIKNDTGAVYTVPEWKYNDYSYSAAYIANQENRQIQVSFDSNVLNMHMLVKLSVISGDGIGEICNKFISNYQKLQWITLTLDGIIPSSVDKRDYTWKWEIYGIPVNNSQYCSQTTNTNTTHSYYTVLDTPQAPMTQPWSSVLEFACGWAKGQNTAANSASRITDSVYVCGYNYGSGAPRYCSTWSNFYLKLMLTEIGYPYDIICIDVAKIVTTFCNSIGCDVRLVLISNGFKYNCIDPIGATTPTNWGSGTPRLKNDCRAGGFSYHAFVQNENYRTWDACLRYDTDVTPDNVYGSNPSCGTVISNHTWHLPCNEEESTYVSRLIDAWTTSRDCANPYDCVVFDYTNEITIE